VGTNATRLASPENAANIESRLPVDLVLANAIAAALLAIWVGFFFSGLVAANYRDGLCCYADSAFHAHVAKNFAFGHGYSTSLDANIPGGFSAFDPKVQAGPVVIFPAALLIRFFGNLYWVPGLATILSIFGLGLCLFLLHLRQQRLWQASLYLLTFLFIAYAAPAQSQGEWYALMGEIPAGLLAVLGISLVASDSRRTIALGTLLMGCATHAKILALLPCVPALAWVVISDWRRHGPLSAIITASRTATLLLLPWGLLLLWQLCSLGMAAFVGLQLMTFKTIVAHPGIVGITPGILARISTHAAQFEVDNGFSLLTMAGLGALSFLVIWRLGETIAKRRAALLLIASILHFTWWLALSNGWQRYTLLGFMTYAAGISLAVISPRAKLGFGIAALLIVGTNLGLVPASRRPANSLHPADFERSERLQHLLQAVDVLKQLRAQRPFVSGFWAPMVDLEYLLPDSANFVPYLGISSEAGSRTFILAYNAQYLQWSWPPSDVTELQKQCLDIYAAEPYYIKRCVAQAADVHRAP
jgi:hypothetical protein